MAPRPRDHLARIDHIVVLMLEGRSFDSVFGHLHGLPDDAANTWRRPASPDREPPPDRVFPAWSEPGRTWPQLTSPSPAPSTRFGHIQQQIHGLPEPLPAGAPACDAPGELGPMGGFVQSYAAVLEGRPDDPKDDSSTPVGHVMNVLHPDQLPVLSELARTFRVVDSWFAAAPCGPLQNRLFALAGTGGGHVDALDAEGFPRVPFFGLSVMGQLRWARQEALEQGGSASDWRCYFGDFPLTLALTDTWADLDDAHLRPFSRFARDVAAGELPALTWIEPAWQVDPSDGAPPHDLTEAEALVARVYNALRSGPAWSRTLLVLTFGGHGGCYDHVPPRRARPPGGPTPDGYSFDDTGVRVPALLISDYTLDRGVSRAARSLHFDHTSLLALLRERWELDLPLSDREEAAHSLSVFLEHAREGAPERLEVPEPLPEIVALRQQALADAAELLAAKAAGATWEELKHMFLGDLAQLAEQAVFTTLEPYLDTLLDMVADRVPVGFLARWLRDLDDELMELVQGFLDSQQRGGALAGRLAVSEHQQLVGWLARFVVAHHAEHLASPLVPDRIEALRREAGPATALQRLDVVEAIQAFRQFLRERDEASAGVAGAAGGSEDPGVSA